MSYQRIERISEEVLAARWIASSATRSSTPA